MHIAAGRFADGDRRIFHHPQCERIDTLGRSAHELVDEAASLRRPLLQGVGDDLLRLFRVEQNRSRVPPVLERQRVQSCKDARETRRRESVDGHDLNVLVSNHRLNAGFEAHAAN